MTTADRERAMELERDLREAKAIAEVHSWPLMSTVAAEVERESCELRLQAQIKTIEALLNDRDSLAAKLAECEAERDALRDANDRAEKFHMAGLENRAHKAERDTSEAIAAWIERDAAELGKQAETEPNLALRSEYRDMFQALTDLAADIRSGAWRSK